MPKIGFPELIIYGMLVTILLMIISDRERN
jgi:hypothetical protein